MSVQKSDTPLLRQPLILASASPRRREILSLLGLPFETAPAPGEAAPDPSLPPEQAALCIARDKAEQVARLYPEQEASARFFVRGHGWLHAYCNHHGLFRVRL